MVALDPRTRDSIEDAIKKHQVAVHGHAQYTIPHHENIFTC